RQRAQEAIHASAVPIWAGDVSFRMTDFATRNAERAGVKQAIEFKTADALQRPAPAAAGLIAMNPPYGERMPPKGQGQSTGEEFEGAGGAGRLLGRPGGALEEALGRLDRPGAHARAETAGPDAPEGKPARADVERRDRVPPVPLRHRVGIEPLGLVLVE